MRSPLLLFVPACALLLAACERSSTAPDAAAKHVAAKPEGWFLFGGPVWTPVSLPFAPAAINDAGVIVGRQNGEAVRWENGTLTLLPRILTIAGPYSAIAITAQGLILGAAPGHALLWTSPSATPIDLSGSIPVAAVGVNDSYTVVANGLGRPWKWTPATGLQPMTAAQDGSEVTGLNATGYASGVQRTDVGVLPVRWDPSGVRTVLPVIEAGGATAQAINDRGDIVGNSISCLPVYACLSTVLVWHFDGSLSEDFGAPAGTAVSLSNAGRIIGDSSWTFYNGALTNLPLSNGFSASSSVNAARSLVTGVNTCGSIVGVRLGIANAGILWKRGSMGIAPACDVTTPIATL